MCGTTRVFFAIAIPDQFGQDLVRLQRALMPELPRCQWATTMPFHLTLAFLGDVRNRNLNDLFGRVASAVCSFEPFELKLAGLGAFPSPVRPRVLWAGLSGRDPELFLNVRKSVVAAAAEAGCRCADERFHPHVTLGRFKFARHAGLARPDRSHGDDIALWSSGGFTAHEVVGFATRLVGGRPSYDALSQGRLEGKKSTAPP